jgi:SAM-dependent methyltransferase
MSVSGEPDRVDALLDEAKRQPFVGWDFSWLRGRLDSQPLPWDYTATVVEHARSSPDLLELGTGGGEWLAELSYRPPRTVATEAWGPNVAIARARLRPLGVDVVQVTPARDNTGKPVEGTASPLPFRDKAFHLVVDRHESFDVGEVARILVPGGWFITQQVDAGNDREYRALFGIDSPEPDPKSRWASWLPGQLERAGLRVVEQASAPLVQVIRDVGALAWGLNAIPWMVPGFSIDKYRARLREIQARIDRTGPITVRQRRFWARAQKDS